jgi:AcrR family transcriptional regulator
MSTARKLSAAASALLDAGGEDAVTLRAVAQAVGVSYNAPYKHFKSRNALLAAVVADDFAMLSNAVHSIRLSPTKPMDKLKRALTVFAEFGQQKPARYRLMANNPEIATQGSSVDEAAFSTFGEFSAVVEECRAAGDLPNVPGPALAARRGIALSSNRKNRVFRAPATKSINQTNDQTSLREA